MREIFILLLLFFHLTVSAQVDKGKPLLFYNITTIEKPWIMFS